MLFQMQKKSKNKEVSCVGTTGNRAGILENFYRAPADNLEFSAYLPPKITFEEIACI
jgi:hypothetical protein